jgi:hypothetical protein
MMTRKSTLEKRPVGISKEEKTGNILYRKEISCENAKCVGLTQDSVQCGSGINGVIFSGYTARTLVIVTVELGL